MGQVWAAHDQVLGRAVAVKVQAVEGGTSNELERFRREAQAAAGLGHPNVVTIFDAGVDDGVAFMVMELLPGPDLATYVRSRGVLPESEAIAVAEQIAAGLAAAHAAGVVHRDIKPANVMFHGPGTVKIVDFGIARLAQTSAARLTATNTLVGSAPYLSPEQAEGRPADERSDIYALGCVLMTMLTGRPPFEGDHPLAVMHQHASSVAPRLSERRPEISASLDQLASEMLAKAPEDRPATAQEVIGRLRRLDPARQRAVGAAVAGVAATRVMAAPTRSLAVEAEAPTGVRPVPGRKVPARMLTAAGGAALLVAVVVMALVLGRPASDAQEEPLPVTTTTTTTATAPATPVAAPSVADEAPRSASRSATTEATAPRAAAQSSTSAPSGPDLPQALSGLRTAVDAEITGGGLDEKKAKDLTKRVEELDEKLRDADDEDDAKDAAKEVRELDKYVADLTRKGELSAESARRIQAALAEVRAAL